MTYNCFWIWPYNWSLYLESQQWVSFVKADECLSWFCVTWSLEWEKEGQYGHTWFFLYLQFRFDKSLVNLLILFCWSLILKTASNMPIPTRKACCCPLRYYLQIGGRMNPACLYFWTSLLCRKIAMHLVLDSLFKNPFVSRHPCFRAILRSSLEGVVPCRQIFPTYPFVSD